MVMNAKDSNKIQRNRYVGLAILTIVLLIIVVGVGLYNIGIIEVKGDSESKIKIMTKMIDEANAKESEIVIFNAIKQVYSMFTLNDLQNSNLYGEDVKLPDKATYAQVVLADSVVLIVGYFNENGHFISTMKKYDDKDVCIGNNYE